MYIAGNSTPDFRIRGKVLKNHIPKLFVEVVNLFDDKTLFFKVLYKMFCAFNIDNFDSINLKCDPELSIELREKYNSVVPGYHMNKEHWNTAHTNQDASDQEIYS